MYVRHLSVTDFRSWPAAEVAFEPGPSVLVGPNGQGKTNLVEAIDYLSRLTSHRVATDAPLVRSGAQQAVVRAAVVKELFNTKGREGVIGTYDIDKNGDTTLTDSFLLSSATSALSCLRRFMAASISTSMLI